jgi:hypothetical protein
MSVIKIVDNYDPFMGDDLAPTYSSIDRLPGRRVVPAYAGGRYAPAHIGPRCGSCRPPPNHPTIEIADPHDLEDWTESMKKDGCPGVMFVSMNACRYCKEYKPLFDANADRLSEHMCVFTLNYTEVSYNFGPIQIGEVQPTSFPTILMFNGTSWETISDRNNFDQMIDMAGAMDEDEPRYTRRAVHMNSRGVGGA